MSDPNPLQTACDEVAAVVATVDGIRFASGEPGEQSSGFPFVDIYIKSSRYTGSHPNGALTGIHTMKIDLHLSVSPGIPSNASEMHRYRHHVSRALVKALKDSTLSPSGTILSLDDIAPENAIFPEADRLTVGIQWSMTMKTQEALI